VFGECRRRRRSRVAATAVATALALVVGAAAAGGGVALAERNAAQPVFREAKAPVDERVADLVRRMTLEEKVGQMTQIAVTRLRGDCEWTNGAWRPDCLKAVFDEAKTGSILSGGGMPPPDNTPEDWAEMVNFLQRYAIKNHRLDIPIIYGVDAVHGHNNVIGATIFPHQIGLGATWDPVLHEELGAATAKVVKATGPTWNFAPVADLARDMRWGRYYETYSEDPYLAGSLAAKTIRGMQASGEVAATVKHFAGYSEPINGHDRMPADMSMRYLQDTHLPAYKAAIDSGAQTLMVNSGAVNGVPAHASRYLLTDVLRKQWGFKGVVISDWEDIRVLMTRYRLATDYKHAIALTVNAGVDMAMEPYFAKDFTSNLLAAVDDELVSRQRIDQAVSRILSLKFRQGLFENPYVDPSNANQAVVGADLGLARKAATESLVLLRNQNSILPFGDSTRRIVVTGESADNLANQMGGWTIGWQGMSETDGVPGTTVLAGLKAGAPTGTTVEHAKTKAEAVEATKNADAAVVVIGEKPGAEGPNDKEVPSFTTEQQDLVEALQATGKPVVAVLLTGRPLVLGGVNRAGALVAAWLPGSEGGNAVADVVFGKANPSGRLSVSWPKTTGDVPMYYQYLPGNNMGESSGYDPQYAFAHGLSYTTYEIRSASVASSTVPRDGTVRVSVTVANTGARAGDMVVPVYVSQPVSAGLVPDKRLVAYTRVTLAPGEEKTVGLSFPAARLAVTPGDVNGSGKPRVLPGSYEVVAGEHKAAFTIR
jgi:beta-glucosidase